MDKQLLKRGGAVLAPSLFTLGNMACGFYALLSSVRGEFVSSATAIIAGMLFDALDGRVARLVHGESEFGVFGFREPIENERDFLQRNGSRCILWWC